MIRRITLTNFMSHRHTVIDLADGLNVLTGDNNCGKSAIVEALKSVCENSGKDYVIRHGEKECVVTIETNDGDVIEWRRKKKKSKYIINGREIDRLNRSLPSDLHGLLRLPEVESEKESFDVHFGKQREPIFLLDKAASRRATFFASSSDAARLLEMQSLHKNNVHDAGRNQKLLLQKHVKLSRRLENLEPVERLDPRLEQIEAEHRRLGENATRIDGLRARIGVLRKLRRDCDSYQATANALQDVRRPPELPSTIAIAQLLRQLTDTVREIEKYTEQVAKFETFETPPQLNDTPGLVLLTTEINSSRRQLESAQQQLAIFEGLERSPKFESMDALAKLLDRTKRGTSNVKRLRESLASMDTVSSPPVLNDAGQLQDLISRFEQRQRAVKTQELEIQGICAEIAEIEQDIRDCADQIDVCPTCGQHVDPDQWVEELTARAGARK